jgi:hypothetical protein
MRLGDGRYECAQCGEVLDIPSGTEPRIVMKAAAGERNVYAIQVGARDVHSCDWVPPEQTSWMAGDATS